MQQRPALTELIEAVAAFLGTEVRPVVEDRAVRFRLLIASNLLQQVAAELAQQDTLRGDELASLVGVMEELTGVEDPGNTAGAGAPSSSSAQHARIGELEQRLATHIRDGTASDEELATIRRHLLDTLAATLAATDPKFDLGMDIE